MKNVLSPPNEAISHGQLYERKGIIKIRRNWGADHNYSFFQQENAPDQPVITMLVIDGYKMQSNASKE